MGFDRERTINVPTPSVSFSILGATLPARLFKIVPCSPTPKEFHGLSLELSNRGRLCGWFL